MTSRRHTILLTKVALLAIALGLCVVGRRNSAWPLTLWGMFSTRTDQYPASTKTSVQLRVWDDEGKQRALFPWDLLPPEQDWFARVAVEHAVAEDNRRGRDRFRAFLVHAASRVLSADVERIECWQVTWAVRPLEVPPLDVDLPLREVRLGGFSADDLW